MQLVQGEGEKGVRTICPGPHQCSTLHHLSTSKFFPLLTNEYLLFHFTYVRLGGFQVNYERATVFVEDIVVRKVSVREACEVNEVHSIDHFRSKSKLLAR